MYATPVIYPLSKAPESIRDFIAYNPLSPIIEGLRLALLGRGQMDYASLLTAAGIILVITFVGIVIFNKTEKDFIDTV